MILPGIKLLWYEDDTKLFLVAYHGYSKKIVNNNYQTLNLKSVATLTK